ncbi:MAG: hypothetical protein HY314_12125 [Acidobacteria bacterium]|nr:hypothetical protein [Acidobacteriota bacterium]
MIRIVTLMTLVLLLAPSATWSLSVKGVSDAQESQPQQQTNSWTNEEYQAFYTASSDPDLIKRTHLLEQFLAKYPQSALAPLVRRNLVFIYIQNQNLNKAFETTESYLSPKPAFKITNQSLESLKSAGLPDDVLGKLASVKDQRIVGEEEFSGTVSQAIGEESTAQFKSSILDHARTNDYAEAFKFAYGRLLEQASATLPTKPRDDFDLLINLIVVANGAARSKNTGLDAPTLRYIEAASAMVKADSVPPTIPPPRWTGNEKAFEAILQQTVGLIKFNNQKYDEAVPALQKAGELAPTDPVTFYVYGESVRLGKYAEARKAVEEARQEYNDITQQLEQIETQVNEINAELEKLSKLPETSKNKARIEELKKQGEELNAKGKELSDQVQPLSDQVDQKVAQTDQVVDEMIRVYAKTAALTDNNASLKSLNQPARQYLESYYKYRHQNSLEGLPELIQKMKTELP